MNTLKNYFTLLLMLAVYSVSAHVAAAKVDSVRLWRAPDHTRVVLDLSAPVEHKILTLSAPNRVVVDIENADLKATLSQLDIKGTPIQRLRSASRNGDDLRLVIDLSQSVKPRSFLLGKAKGKTDRLVIDLHDVKSDTPKAKKLASDHNKKRDIIVAIDAGHGGEDPGASGPGKLREKQVVLQIARKLKSKIDQQPGFKAELVRDGDYYIGLYARRDKARKFNADLFVSIHADAFSSPQANGTSVYALSRSGASSASARFLAQKENNSDMIGGVKVDDKDDMLTGVLFDLSMTATQDASLTVGADVLSSMGGISRLHKKQVEQAGFAVLKSPDVPSILVETGFISNPKEAKRLSTRAYQNKMSNAIFSGIQAYFRRNPPAGTLIAWQKKNQRPEHEYVIARGDTLSQIANRHRVTVASIRTQNGIKGNRIKIGQRITIPAS
mgnify:CR=1 FL=1